MNAILRSALAVAGVAFTTQLAAQVTFYEHESFRGRSFTSEQQIGNFERYGFNDRASSVEILGSHWEVCDDAQFSGRCVVLRPGRYPSLASMGLNDRVSSVRAVSTTTRVDDNRYAPLRSLRKSPSTKTKAFTGGLSLRTDKSVLLHPTVSKTVATQIARTGMRRFTAPSVFRRSSK